MFDALAPDLPVSKSGADRGCEAVAERRASHARRGVSTSLLARIISGSHTSGGGNLPVNFGGEEFGHEVLVVSAQFI